MKTLPPPHAERIRGLHEVLWSVDPATETWTPTTAWGDAATVIYAAQAVTDAIHALEEVTP